MKFIDSCLIWLQAGRGGDGSVAFRREKYVPKGGPCGGDGGKGGDVFLRASRCLLNLCQFRYKTHFIAGDGEKGGKNNRKGKKGKDLVIELPIGTQVFDSKGKKLLFDMIEDGQEVLFLEGGKGGLGNVKFKSSINQTPGEFTLGEKSAGCWVRLELKLLADVGIIGLPNAGKSTFINRVSKAKSEVGDYPFTTLSPVLGKVFRMDKEFIVADIPGLIEGASRGRGLGCHFLKHIERCEILIHLISIQQVDLLSSYETIRKELENFSLKCSNKIEIIVITKIDLFTPEEIEKKTVVFKKKLSMAKKKIFFISAICNLGITSLLDEIFTRTCPSEKVNKKKNWSPL